MKTLLAVVIVVSVLASSPAGAAVSPGRLGVGDSIMVSTADELDVFKWDVDAEIGRQFATGVRVIRRRAAHDRLPRRLIVHLGTNGPIEETGCSDLAAAAGREPRIFLVTLKVPRGWQEANNDLLRGCAASFRKVHLIRWYAHSRRHDEWFADDGYHLSRVGQDEYASFLDARVDAILRQLRA